MHSLGLSRSSFFLSPFGFGGVGMGVGGGSGLFNLAFLALCAFLVYNSFTSGSQSSQDGVRLEGDRVAVVRLQVGLLGLARSLQLELDAIANKADMDTPQGMLYVLQETVLSLLRHPDYCVYGSSGNKSCKSVAEAESKFSELSLEERSKFEAETLVNVGKAGVRRSSTSAGAGSEAANEFILVTLLVAADGPLKLPPVSSLEELKTALKRLGAVRADALQAVEVLWTPQEEGDTLTLGELTRNYPTLSNL